MLCGFGRSTSTGVHARLSDVILMKPSVNEDGVKQWSCTLMDAIGNGPGIYVRSVQLLILAIIVMVYIKLTVMYTCRCHNASPSDIAI